MEDLLIRKNIFMNNPKEKKTTIFIFIKKKIK